MLKTLFAAALFVSIAAAAPAQTLPAPVAHQVTVRGADGKSFIIDDKAMTAGLRVTLRATMRGETHDYAGMALAPLLARVGAPMGSALSGDALTTAVLVTAADGYQVVFSLAELDPAMRKGGAILADRMDGKPLSGFDGPYRLIADGDLRPARSVRMVTRIDVRDVGTP